MKYCSVEQLLEKATHVATPTIKQIAALMKSGAEIWVPKLGRAIREGCSDSVEWRRTTGWF
jgi:hypothetical protein